MKKLTTSTKYLIISLLFFLVITIANQIVQKKGEILNNDTSPIVKTLEEKTGEKIELLKNDLYIKDYSIPVITHSNLNLITKVKDIENVVTLIIPNANIVRAGYDDINVAEGDFTGNNFGNSYRLFPVGDNFDRNLDDVENKPSDYHLEEFAGHSLQEAMGIIVPIKNATRGLYANRGVKDGDKAYLLFNDGRVKIFTTDYIEPHVYEVRFSLNGDGQRGSATFSVNQKFDSTGQYIKDRYMGKGFDVLYTGCCNDTYQYSGYAEEGYSYKTDPGEYGIFWRRIG